MTILHFIPDEMNPPKKTSMLSPVCVIGEEKDYTPSEIALLEEFANRRVTWNSFLGKDKSKMQYVFFKKGSDERWYRRKELWSDANCIVPTLNEALATMYRAHGMSLPDWLGKKINPPRHDPPAVVRLRENPCLS